MLRTIYDRLASLNLGIGLTFGVLVFLGIGSFSGGGAESSSINDMPLFAWLREAPVAASWWLWATILLLAMLALSTVLCSIESLRNKYGRTRFLMLIAPQVMHLGFLLIVLAHLFSAYGGFKEVLQVYEGTAIGFPDGERVQVAAISAVAGPMGMMTDFGAEFRYGAAGNEKSQTVRPNEPLFFKGVGFYVKDVQMYPTRAALVEIHREPGAGIALAGALLFTIGNVVLLSVRRGK